MHRTGRGYFKMKDVKCEGARPKEKRSLMDVVKDKQRVGVTER